MSVKEFTGMQGLLWRILNELEITEVQLTMLDRRLDAIRNALSIAYEQERAQGRDPQLRPQWLTTLFEETGIIRKAKDERKPPRDSG